MKLSALMIAALVSLSGAAMANGNAAPAAAPSAPAKVEAKNEVKSDVKAQAKAAKKVARKHNKKKQAGATTQRAVARKTARG